MIDRARRRFFCASLGIGSLVLLPRHLRAQPGIPSSVDALALDGSVKSLASASLADLAAELQGALLLPQTPAYDSARRLFFSERFDRRPAFVVQPTGAADVALAVNFARENGLLLAVKGGGHSDFGISSHEQAMMLDLRLLRGVRIEPGMRRAWVAGATPAGLIDHESGAHLLAVPLGGNPGVGFGGLALGGGFGKLGRAFGLTLDSVRSIDVVCADGQARTASAHENPDLFWALRGGGGNFGVATGFEVDLHPIRPQVIAGTIRFPFHQLQQVAAAYGNIAREAPDDLYVELLIQVRDTTEASVVQLNVCYSGDLADTQRVLWPLRQLGDVLHDDLKPMNYAAAQNAEAHTTARAPATQMRNTFFRSAFLDALTAPLAFVLADGLRPDARRSIIMLFLHAGGAIARRPAQATSFSHRSAMHDMIFVATAPPGQRLPADAAQIWDRLNPFTHGFYVNEMAGGVSPSEVAANYGANAPRLAALKRRWDPRNLFRLNANILPAASG
jgi:FAD/FMN-containing dehydrogenase